tara:strand:+ start:2353 stop:4809 length:2457 start_codon:yes stop_codon:yes gene_type:complete
LLRGLHEGKYNLLLGAGASYGCKGGDGEYLKDGATLSTQITARFNLPLNADEAKKLPLSYEEAEHTNKAGLKRWLRNRFVGCMPTWQHLLYQMHWERIWTFNIDDVLERAFEIDTSSNKTKQISSLDWKDKLVPIESNPGAIQIVYLHGRALDLDTRKDGLIFSVPEYSQASRTFPQWHASFQTNYIDKPFIVCGASLAEEVDLAEAIRTKNLSAANGYPSFIVSFDLDEGQKGRMRRFNLIPVVCPLGEFFEILVSALNEYRKTAETVSSRLKPGTYERFLAQFRRFDTSDTSAQAIEGTDFYGGDQPTWHDVLGDRDSKFTSTDSAKKYLDRSISRYAVLIHGNSVSGKTTSLLRLAREALQRGYKPFWFRHEEGFNADVVLDYLSEDEKAVLFIDDAAGHMTAIGKVFREAKKKDKNVRMFLSLRSPRLKGFRIDVDDEFRQEIRIGPMSQADIVKFVQKRRRASRLGKHIAESDSKLIKELKIRCKSELLESLSFIEFSEPIRERVRKLVFSGISSDEDRRFFSKVICVHRFGFSLPIRVAMVVSGMQFGRFSSLVDNQLKAEGILVRDERGLRLRHRILSEYAWEQVLNEQERYDAMSSVVTALAPLVNPDVIKMKGIEHLILREVLDQDQVALSIGPKALKFYESHELELGWSSRYWDQRALLESRHEGHFPKAYSYSQKAISLEHHPFAFTSLGTICMRHCIRLMSDNRIEALKYFYEGEEALTTAYELNSSGEKAHEHPFVTFFASSAKLLRTLNPLDSEFEIILELHRIWIERATDSPAFSNFHGKKRIREIRGFQIKESLRMQRARTV